MKITLEIPDGYDDILRVTCIGMAGYKVNVKTHAVLITGHDSDTYTIPIDGNFSKSYWKSGRI